MMYLRRLPRIFIGNTDDEPNTLQVHWGRIGNVDGHANVLLVARQEKIAVRSLSMAFADPFPHLAEDLQEFHGFLAVRVRKRINCVPLVKSWSGPDILNHIIYWSHVNGWISKGRTPSKFQGRRNANGIVLQSQPRTVLRFPLLFGLNEGSAGDSVLPNHLAPHGKRYEGIDGHCKERIPSRFLYGFLSGMCAIALGGRISYRLLVKGDDRTYFYGLIGWQILIPFSFLVTMYGFGALMESALYFTNPCEESHSGEIVSQKGLTTFRSCNTVSDMANVLSADKQTAIIAALAEGSSIRSIERITGVHRDTVMRLGVRVGKGCQVLLDSKMQDLGCNYLQLDEVWGFIWKKERHCSVDDNPEFGDVWTFCAIDSETKLVPSFKCGKRNAETANAFVQDIANRVRNRVQISTDALGAYGEAIERAFGADVDYGQIVKVYVHDAAQHPERKYSAPHFASAYRRPIAGNPEMEFVSTSHVERLNATTRLHVKRLSRLTLAFSKKLENFEAAVGLHFAYYNFVKRHNTLRCTPAMAAGVERDFWSVSDLVEATV